MADLHWWASTFSPFNPFANDNPFVSSSTNGQNDKLPFARWANGKRIKENRLGFLFPVGVSISPCLYVSISMFREFRKRKMEPTEIGNFHLFVANGKRKTSICLLKTEPELCFSWSANDKRQLMIAVSANVSMYTDLIPLYQPFIWVRTTVSNRQLIHLQYNAAKMVKTSYDCNNFLYMDNVTRLAWICGTISRSIFTVVWQQP
jgi:hypothetical protein